MAAGLSASRGVLDVSLAVPLYTVGMFLAAFFCNGELALRKPAPRYLTQFYLTISLGGALGGMFVGLVAPRIFPTYFELPLALVLLAALAVFVARQEPVADRPGDRRQRWRPRWYGSRVPRLPARRRRLHAPQLLRHAARERTGRRRPAGAPAAARRDPARRAVDDQCRDRLEPGTYYARTSGRRPRDRGQAGDGPVRLGVVGLGVGTLVGVRTRR